MASRRKSKKVTGQRWACRFSIKSQLANLNVSNRRPGGCPRAEARVIVRVRPEAGIPDRLHSRTRLAGGHALARAARRHHHSRLHRGRAQGRAAAGVAAAVYSSVSVQSARGLGGREPRPCRRRQRQRRRRRVDSPRAPAPSDGAAAQAPRCACCACCACCARCACCTCCACRGGAWLDGKGTPPRRARLGPGAADGLDAGEGRDDGCSLRGPPRLGCFHAPADRRLARRLRPRPR